MSSSGDEGKAAPFGDYGTAAVGLPPLTESRRNTYEYYRMQFLPDGYPGRRTAEGVVAHPLYGTYVIADYLAQYRTTKDPVFLDAATRVGKAALGRMETLEGQLVFMYDPGIGLSSLPIRFYSGLTQARWMITFARLDAQLPTSEFSAAAESVLGSLMIPCEKGGVLREHGHGVVIEEYAHEIPDYTLNGWTTALLQVDDYRRLTGSERAAELVQRNLTALRQLLPLYDVPELANSRYRLTGKVRLRVIAAGSPITFVSGGISVPGQGVYEIHSNARKDATTNTASVVGERRFDVNGLLLYASVPEANRLTVTMDSQTEGSIRVLIGTGTYDPRRAHLHPDRFVELSRARVSGGRTTIDVPIDWSQAPLVAHPTGWYKRIAGRLVNIYHFMHIANLTKINDRYPDPLFSGYAERWRDYTKLWPSMPIYSDPELLLTEWNPHG